MRAGTRLSILALIALLSSAASAGSRSGYSMEILVDGRPVTELPHGTRTYIEAARGREYAVRLTNHTGERVAAALAVDGLNSVDAQRTSAREATKWILGPWESIVIEGWQTSGSTARRFFFTTEDRSYGAWLGKTEDLGVISAAFFRERQHYQEYDSYKMRQDPAQRRDSAGEGKRSQAPASESQAAPPSQDNAATGIGREMDHRVRRIAFDEEDSPAAVVSLRYEYRDALVKLGVLPQPRFHDDPLARRERARGFEDTGYAPDPYGCCR